MFVVRLLVFMLVSVGIVRIVFLLFGEDGVFKGFKNFLDLYFWILLLLVCIPFGLLFFRWWKKRIGRGDVKVRFLR